MRAGTRTQQLERADGVRVGVELVRRRIADQERHLPNRGRREPLRATEPFVTPASGEGPSRAVGAVLAMQFIERRQQDLLYRPLERPESERRFHGGVRTVAVEGRKRPDQRIGIGTQSFARATDGRRDRQPLLKRVAQRGNLPVRVEAVLPGRPLGLRIPEASLPCAKRVGADIEESCSLTGLKKAHGILHRSTSRLSLSDRGSFRTDKSAKVVHFGDGVGTVNPSSKLAICAGKEAV